MNGVEVVKGGGQCSGWDGTGLGFNKIYISFVDVVHFNMRKAFAVWLHVPSLQLLSTSFLTRVLTCSLVRNYWNMKRYIPYY